MANPTNYPNYNPRPIYPSATRQLIAHHGDVDDLITPSIGDVLKYDGIEWIADTDAGAVAVHATIYNDAASAAQSTNATPGTYDTLIFDTGINGAAATLVPDAPNSVITIPAGNEGLYSIEYSASFLGDPNETYTIAPFSDSTRLPDGATRARMPGANVSLSVAGHCLVGISSAATNISLGVTANGPSAQIVSSHLSLTVTKA